MLKHLKQFILPNKNVWTELFKKQHARSPNTSQNTNIFFDACTHHINNLVYWDRTSGPCETGEQDRQCESASDVACTGDLGRQCSVGVGEGVWPSALKFCWFVGYI